MGLSISLTLFLAVMVIYIILIDVFSIFFRRTGLPAEKARFQVVSLLTNSGFTTLESEVVLQVSARRKMARRVMIFGYVFSITVVSVFVNVLMSIPTYAEDELWPILITAALLFVIFLLAKRVPSIEEFFDKRIGNWAWKKIYGRRENTIVLVDEYRKGSLAKVLLKTVPKEIAGKSIRDARLAKKHGIFVVFLERDGGKMKKVKKKTVLKEGDVVTLYGDFSKINRIFGI
ncbi:hypothetical protein LJC56_03140 [Christensenellaceae bacterium OttesenSCG-928-K19]|nr:hypothetical protein [Christensenellaceae bacterium OttesenSCG-928-K19]